SVLWGLYQNATTHGKLTRACELGEQLLALAHQYQDPALLPMAHFAIGFILFYLGQFAKAQAHAEQGLAIYEPDKHGSLAFLYGQDLGVNCHISGGWSLWYLGYPDHAVKHSQEAFALARELHHSFSSVLALALAALVHHFRRDVTAT